MKTSTNSADWFYERFERQSRYDQYWLNCAEQLHRAATAVDKVKFAEDVARMLEGLALEVLFKGCIVRRDGNAKNAKPDHDLPAHAKRAGLRVSRNTELYLRALGQFVEWLGKYPTPKTKVKWAKALVALENLREPSSPHHGKSKSVLGRRSTKLSPNRALNSANYIRIWNAAYERFHDIPELTN